MASKQKNNKGVSTSFVRTIAIVTVIFLGYQGIQIAKISYNLDNQLEEAGKEVAAESKNLNELNLEYENIESLNTVESIAREKLGLVKKDEIVFREKY